jgi:hypothetical protein
MCSGQFFISSYSFLSKPVKLLCRNQWRLLRNVNRQRDPEPEVVTSAF